MENRNGLAVDGALTRSSGAAECAATSKQLLNAIDGRTTRHPGYGVSRKTRKGI